MSSKINDLESQVANHTADKAAIDPPYNTNMQSQRMKILVAKTSSAMSAPQTRQVM